MELSTKVDTEDTAEVLYEKPPVSSVSSVAESYCTATVVAAFSELWYFRIALKSASAMRCR